MTDKYDSFTDLLRGALGTLLTPAEDFLQLFTNDIVFEFPYAPLGMTSRLEGRIALAEHLVHLGPLLEFGQFTLHSAHTDRNTTFLEFSCQGKGKLTGHPYDQAYISVVTTCNGRISRYRDYWNPLVLLAALESSETTALTSSSDTTHG